MKKKILGGIVAVAIAAVAAVNMNIGSPNSSAPMVSMSNVEALAQGEVNPDCPNGCYDDGDGCYCHVWYPSYKEAGNNY